MLYQCEIRGIRPIIHHSGAGLDPRTPANLEKAEIARKRGSNRTESDEARLRELECLTALWLDGETPAIPATALRACIETAARKLKQGPQVREGLIVTGSKFIYDTGRYGTTLQELGQKAQFTTGVVVQRSRVLRTRAMFDLPWSCEFELDCDDELVDRTQLETWLDIAGRRIGLGDWRPEKSGDYGRALRPWPSRPPGSRIAQRGEARRSSAVHGGVGHGPARQGGDIEASSVGLGAARLG